MLLSPLSRRIINGGRGGRGVDHDDNDTDVNQVRSPPLTKEEPLIGICSRRRDDATPSPDPTVISSATSSGDDELHSLDTIEADASLSLSQMTLETIWGNGSCAAEEGDEEDIFFRLQRLKFERLLRERSDADASTTATKEKSSAASATRSAARMDARDDKRDSAVAVVVTPMTAKTRAERGDATEGRGRTQYELRDRPAASPSNPFAPGGQVDRHSIIIDDGPTCVDGGQDDPHHHHCSFDASTINTRTDLDDTFVFGGVLEDDCDNASSSSVRIGIARPSYYDGDVVGPGTESATTTTAVTIHGHGLSSSFRPLPPEHHDDPTMQQLVLQPPSSSSSSSSTCCGATAYSCDKSKGSTRSNGSSSTSRTGGSKSSARSRASCATEKSGIERVVHEPTSREGSRRRHHHHRQRRENEDDDGVADKDKERRDEEVVDGEGEGASERRRRHHRRRDYKIFVLLLEPSRKIFELIQILYDYHTATIGDLLRLIPENATDPRLGRQRHVGLCRPTDGIALTNRSLLASGRGLPRDVCARIHRGEILVAMPRSYTGEQIVRLAGPILKNPKLTSLLERADPLAPRRGKGSRGSSRRSRKSGYGSRNAPSIATVPEEVDGGEAEGDGGEAQQHHPATDPCEGHPFETIETKQALTSTVVVPEKENEEEVRGWAPLLTIPNNTNGDDDDTEIEEIKKAAAVAASEAASAVLARKIGEMAERLSLMERERKEMERDLCRDNKKRAATADESGAPGLTSHHVVVESTPPPCNELVVRKEDQEFDADDASAYLAQKIEEMAAEHERLVAARKSPQSLEASLVLDVTHPTVEVDEEGRDDDGLVAMRTAPEPAPQTPVVTRAALEEAVQADLVVDLPLIVLALRRAISSSVRRVAARCRGRMGQIRHQMEDRIPHMSHEAVAVLVLCAVMSLAVWRFLNDPQARVVGGRSNDPLGAPGLVQTVAFFALMVCGQRYFNQASLPSPSLPRRRRGNAIGHTPSYHRRASPGYGGPSPYHINRRWR